MSKTSFLVLFVIFMMLTYFWRFAAIGVVMDEGGDPNIIGNTVIVLLLISYGFMAYAAYSRGKAINKNGLVAFPIIAGVFDIILVFVPFVPTIFNIITIVLAMQDRPEEPTAGKFAG